ncbi:hypothetical protein EDEG_03730 [Edhazardia aedis USNM 41457]|uniref:Uncharacterized protein n=1 Tax=Edhazardia aedis (strain USNM 41457) TaxID=1003232 RepID=J9D2E5_EDHAE|nr:hypothetical protein EDEG_03730 [Edhazardia aedis USNM 41457]|eukprot:EJW01749.1 hypothetical protein EDEG_03730 [Edhazardia aedis USNM 41457]
MKVLLVRVVVIFGFLLKYTKSSYDFKTQEKYIVATNLTREYSVNLRQDRFIRNFNSLYLERALILERNKSKENTETKKNAFRPLNEFYRALYKRAVLDQFNAILKYRKMTLNLKFDEFSIFTSNNISEIVSKNPSIYFHSYKYIGSNYMIMMEEFYDDLENNKKWYEPKLYELSKRVINDLSEYLKLDIFEILNFFDYTKWYKHECGDKREPITWDFVSGYEEYKYSVFFDKIGKKISENPMNTRFYVRFDIEPVFSCFGIFKSMVNMVKSTTEGNRYAISKDVNLKNIDDQLFVSVIDMLMDNIEGFCKLYRYAKERSSKLIICNFIEKYDTLALVTHHLNNVNLEEITIKGVSIIYIKNTIVLFSEYFISTWKLIIRSFEIYQENTPHTIIKENIFLVDSLYEFAKINQRNKDQKNRKKLYDALIEYKKEFSCVYKEYKKMVEIYNEISLWGSSTTLAMGYTAEESLIDFLKPLFEMVRENEYKVEFQFLFIINNYNVLIEKLYIYEDITEYESERHIQKIAENTKILKDHAFSINSFLNDLVFDVKVIGKTVCIDTCEITKVQTCHEKFSHVDITASVSDLPKILKEEKISTIQLKFFDVCKIFKN